MTRRELLTDAGVEHDRDRLYLSHMRSRTRFIAGLVALVAMVASLAETAVASACLPMEAMDAAAMPDMAGMSAPDAPPCDDCVPAGEREQDDRSDVPDCPFGLVGAGSGCSPVATRPTASAADVKIAVSGTTIHATSEVGHPQLWVAALFRPPRA